MKSLEESISIIIPIYNSEKYLQDCLNSILDETVKDYEIILVDDGSTDSSLNICNKYKENYPNIKVISQENKGVSVARNEGIKIAKNDWIMFIDSDDKLNKDFWENVNKDMKKNSDLIMYTYSRDDDKSCGNREKYNIDINLLRKSLLSFSSYKSKYKKEMLIDNMILWTCWGKLYRRDIINKYKIEFSKELYLGEDLLFNFVYFKYINDILFVNHQIYFYRVIPTSVTGQFSNNRIKNTVNLINLLKKEIDNGGFEELEVDFRQFIIGRVITCYLMYFSNKYNKKDNYSLKKELQEFCELDTVRNAIKNGFYKKLSLKKKQEIKYSMILFLLKRRRYDMLISKKNLIG